MSRLFQDALKANKNAQVFTGDPTFIGTSEQGNIATTEQTKAVIEQFYSYYSSPITYQQIATIGAVGNAIAFDSAGNLYLAITNHYNGSSYNLTSYVYKITPAGSMTTFASVATNGAHGNSLVFDSIGNLYWGVSNHFNGSSYNLTSYVYKITPAGSMTTFASVATNGAVGNAIAFDSAGNLYWGVSNHFNGSSYNITSYVYKITPAGSMTTFASVATIGAHGNAIIFDSIGNLYWGVSNHYNGTIRNLTSYVYKITPVGSMTTFASVATNGAIGNSLAFDSAGNLYWGMSNYYNGTTWNLTSYVYKITPAGSMTTFASVATIGAHGNSLVFDSIGNLYWGISNVYNGSSYNLTSFVYKITPAGSMTTFASVATNGAHGNSLVFDSIGNLYWGISNYSNGTTSNLNSFIYRFNKLTAN
jgi:hypothetical protein